MDAQLKSTDCEYGGPTALVIHAVAKNTERKKAVSSKDSDAGYWMNPDVLQKDFVWPPPKNAPQRYQTMHSKDTTDVTAFWLEDEKQENQTDVVYNPKTDPNIRFIPNGTGGRNMIHCASKCEAAQQRADALCQEIQEGDVKGVHGGDLITQGLACTAAIEHAKQVCEQVEKET